jgi:flagellar export protein FliJ
MPKFIFNLQGVLRHRQMIELHCQRELADAVRTVTGLEQELRALDELVRQADDDLRQGHLTGHVDPTYLAAHRRFILSAQRKGMLLMQRIALAQRQAAQRRQALVQASQQTKILEKLRERQLEDWSQLQQRREFAMLDEAGTQIALRSRGEDSLDADTVDHDA